MAGPVTPGSTQAIFPSSQFAVVTKSDTVPLSYHGTLVKSRGISFGTAGNIAVKDDQGTAVTLIGLGAGVIHPIETDYIMSTNTTASDITAYF